MPHEAQILRTAADLADQGVPYVLITVTAAGGSTPRDPGARMIWRPGAGLEGTVGGGQFEYLVLDAAERHFAQRSTGSEHYVLGADADQCCGGTMDVFFEFIGASRRFVLFGAGHVAHELVAMLEPADLDLVVVDDRPDWNTEDRFTRCRRVLAYDQGVEIACEHPDATLACVMTCSHDTDFEILRQMLAATTAPAFIGLIGSKSKRQCLFGRLVAAGCDQQRVQSITCPIGLADMGKHPRLVAVSVAGQILTKAKELAQL